MKTEKPVSPAPASKPKTETRRSRSSAVTHAYMRSPSTESAYEVGDSVESFCDHEKNEERIRAWLKGVVVQVDNKLVAVQFRSNVYLTDGWMVPDRILWYPTHSEQLRQANQAKKRKE